MKKLSLIFALLLSIPSLAQVINCPSGFTTTGTGACSISTSSATDDFWTNNSGTILSGTADILAPAGAGHNCNNLIRQTKVNVQAFTATWTFVMNGLNHAFVVENQTNQNGQAFCAGAGLEGGFVQFAGSGNIAPDKVFAVQLDSSNPLTEGGSFTYSSAQWYETLQYPSHPLCCGGSYLPEFPITKQSTSPVPLNSPSSTVNTFTGDTYSATVTYDGYTLTLNMFDVTAGGSCPGASCYTKVWTGVYIPSIVGATTAWVGFASGTASPTPTTNLLINTFIYTVNTPTGSPSFTAWNANSTFNTGASSAASPVYSVLPGPYSGTQSVSITTSTSPNNYICYTLSASPPTLYPHPDNSGGCSAGTLYTGPISIASTATLYAMAGSNNSAFATGSQSPTGLGPPSTLVAGTYTISSTIINVNPSMSEATIQGLINGGTSGDTVVFAPGTYNLASNGGNPNGAALNVVAGLTYTGPTSGAPAIIAGTGLYPAMYTSVGATVVHLTFDNSFLFVEDHTTGLTFDNNVIQNMPVCNTTASQTSAIFVAGGINNSDISSNTFSNIGTACEGDQNDNQGAGGIVMFAFHNLTITNNTFNHVREPMDIPISTGGSYDCAGGVITGNVITNAMRIGIELLGSSTKPSGLIVANNSFTLPLNPYFASFGYSLTAGLNMVFHDNISSSNVSGTGPYGVEIAGIGTQAYSNTVEGNWALGFAIGNTQAISITNNTICGPNMNANPSSGSTPSQGNANGFISWEGAAGSGPNSFTGNTTSAALTCGGSPGVVATPTFSPVAGTYTGTQNVTISSTTGGASIVYTNDGTTPTVTALSCTITHGTLYSGPVSVTASKTLKAIGCLTSNTASAVASAAYVINTVTLTTNVPPYGFQVMTGAVRQVAAYPGGSASTKRVNWSTTSGATLSCNTNCIPTVAVTITAAGGTCSVTGTVGNYTLNSTSNVTVTAQSVDDTSKTVTIPFHVCDTSVDAFVDAEPGYDQVFAGQSSTLQSYVVGYINENVTWSIVSQPAGGNATLVDTNNRDTLFSATVTGRYVLKATSVANPSLNATAVRYVAPSTQPRVLSPNQTVTVPCIVDPAATGTVFEVGPTQTYHSLDVLGTNAWTGTGNTIRIHNEDTTGTNPTTYHQVMQIQGMGTQTQPINICGVPDSLGNLPIVDGSNATEDPTDDCVNLSGAGGFKFLNTGGIHFNDGYELGSLGPDYVRVAGIRFQHFNPSYSYHACGSGSLTVYPPDTAAIYVRAGQHVVYEGNDAFQASFFTLFNNNTSATGRAFTQFESIIGNHFSNFGVGGNFGVHALYIESMNTLIEGNLFESPVASDDGDFIKQRGTNSIIRYNTFTGTLGGHTLDYPDMEDTFQFVGVDMNLGVPGDTNCADSIWCSVTSNNITLTHLTDNAEAMAKDFAYANLIASNNINQFQTIEYGSFSAPEECAPCTNMDDRQGRLYFFYNTADKTPPGGITSTANSSTNFTAQPQYDFLTLSLYNNVFWKNSATAFLMNEDTTMIPTFLTNMYQTSSVSITTPITGGTTAGWGGYTGPFAFPLSNPMNTHMTGLTSANFLNAATVPYNTTTFVPNSGSPLLNAATPITDPEIAHMPIRFQPNPSGYMVPRIDGSTTIAAFGPAPVTVLTPTFTPGGGTYPAAQNVTISTATVGGSVIYTTDSSTPSVSSGCTIVNGTLYTGPVSVIVSTTLKAIGCKALSTPSTVATAAYIISIPTVATPTFAPPGSTYTSPQTVTISTITAGASIVWTGDNSIPSVSSGCSITNGTLYTGTISVVASKTLKAIGCMAGSNASAVASAGYIINSPNPPIGFTGAVIEAGSGIWQ